MEWSCALTEKIARCKDSVRPEPFDYVQESLVEGQVSKGEVKLSRVGVAHAIKGSEMRTTLTIDDALASKLKMRALETGKIFGQVVIDSVTNKSRMARKPVGYGNAVWYPNGRINNQLKQAVIETAHLAIRSRKGCFFAGLSKLFCGRLNNETLLNGLQQQAIRKIYRVKPASLGMPLTCVNLDQAFQLADELEDVSLREATLPDRKASDGIAGCKE